jgi:phage tail-like protein
MPSSIINRFSTIATDPLRNFRFYAEFTKAGDEAFDKRILTSSTTNPATAGYSDGWIGGFTFISGLNINTQSIPYREGGYNTTVHQIPGMTTFVPVTFQRGVLYGNDQGITWMKGLFSAASGEGLNTGVNKNFRVNIDIYVMDHPNASATPGTPADDNLPRMRFRVHNAWITGLNYNELNAGDGGILFESMTLVHEGLSVSFVGPDFKPIPKQ